MSSDVPAERINVPLGQLVLNTEGAVIQSSGSLQNADHVAQAVMQCLNAIRDFKPSVGHNKDFKRLSVVFSDHAYVVVQSGKSIRVVLKNVSAAPTLADL